MVDTLIIQNKDELVEYYNQGNNVEFEFFWRNQNLKTDISSGCFSQLYEASFIVGGYKYATAEQYMMAEKAKLFSDNDAFQKILATNNPREAKQIGRGVKGFAEELWISARFKIVVKANFEKFNQNTKLKEFLLSTKNRVIVETSPVDKIWGIGLDSDHAFIENPNKWNGQNLLGFALMQVRNQLERLS